jgi:predicted dienelactone hydrolase
MAPGGYAAFGEEGLANITIPTMIMGGTKDDIMNIKDEAGPIYEYLVVAPAYKMELKQGNHLDFTDLCRVPPFLAMNMCNFASDDAYKILNPFAIAFFRKHLKDENSMDYYLSSTFSHAIPKATIEKKND